MAARVTYLVDLLDEHLDELGFLFGQWRGALRDPDYTLKGLADLEERVRAHLQGIQVPGERALPRLLELLAGDDADLVFASAYALLHVGSPELTEKVVAGFVIAEDEPFDALRTALTYGPLPPAGLERVRALLSARPTMRAVAAAEVLAFHGSLELGGEELRYFLEDEDAAARRAGWRLAARLGAQVAPKTYAAAIRADDPAIAAAALETGAWCGVPGVLPALRQLADGATPERLPVLQLLATLGQPEDLPRLQALVRRPELGPERFRLAAAAGDPRLLEDILAALEDPDPATAAAAAEAFTKLTGVDVESEERATLPPPDGSEPDEFDAEFLDEVALPDPARARREWEALRPRLQGATRLSRGLDVSPPLRPDVLERLDMEARWQACMRGRLHGGWNGSRLDLEVFPQGTRAGAPQERPPSARPLGSAPPARVPALAQPADGRAV